MKTRTLMNRSGLVAAALVCVFLSHANAQEDSPVTIEAELNQSSKTAGEFELTVDLDIKLGWHTYDAVPEGNPSPSTEVALDVPAGVVELGEWDRPVGLPYKNDGLTVFTESVTFSRKLKVEPGETDREIGVVVKYQVCNEDLCQPPQEFETKVVLSGEKPAGPPEFKNDFFSAPERLVVGHQPLNTDAKQMYPSPAMYDVDGDGDMELIVGDIRGSLNVYENTNTTGGSESGDPIWSKFKPLLDANGDKIKVSNW